MAFVQNADLIATGPNAHRPACQCWWYRVTVAIELDPRMGTGDGRHDFVGVEGDRRQLAEQRALVLEAIDGPLAGGFVNPHVSNLVEPPGRERQVILEVDQFLATSGQGISLDVAHA